MTGIREVCLFRAQVVCNVLARIVRNSSEGLSQIPNLFALEQNSPRNSYYGFRVVLFQTKMVYIHQNGVYVKLGEFRYDVWQLKAQAEIQV